MQLRSGAFSFWPGQDDPHLGGSVMAAHVLVLARSGGYDVSAESVDRALSWLHGFLRDGIGPSRTYALYVLALGGRPEPAWLESLPKDAFLGLAAAEMGKTELARKILEHLDAGQTPDVNDFDSYARRDFVRLLARVRAGLPMDARPRDVLARCRTTYERGWACLALAGSSAEAAGSGSVRIFAGGNLVAEAPLDRLTRLAVPAGDLTITSDGPCRYAWHVRGHRPPQPAGDRGFWIRRAYVRVGEDRPRTDFRAGDLVAVRLFVYTPEPRAFVALEDPLPAGLEPLDLRWKTSGRRREESDDFEHVEKRDDRVFASAERLSAGLHEMTWLARVTTAGTFTAPAPTVEEMYDAGVSGRGEAGVVEVAPR